MNTLEQISKTIADGLMRFRKRDAILSVNYGQNFTDFAISKEPFAKCIFLSLCDMLTDLCNDVTLVNAGGNNHMLFAEFRKFFERDGQFVLNLLFEQGFVPIAHGDAGFYILKNSDYTRTIEGDATFITPINKALNVYVMRSQTFRMKGVSDMCLLHPFLEYLDNVLNSSNTTRMRLGAFVIGSPKTYSGAPAAVTLRKEEKERLEEEISRNYGSLAKQKQMMLTQQEMSWTTLNLAGIDAKTYDDVKLAVCAICDRLKIPANQCTIINADASKSLANGSEQREGDFAKYQSFERLLDATFIAMAEAIGLKIDYTIYNKPQRETIQS